MLVPKLRFKREDGTDYPEWSNKSFANAFAPLNNNTFSRDMLSENGTVLNIHYGDILVKFGEVCDIQAMDIPKVNADIDTGRFNELQDGDIILADTAEDETVGKAIEIYHTGASKVVSGLHTMACRPNDKYAQKYMGYYINSPTYHNQLLPFMQGIKVTSIGRKNIADTVIYYPTDMEEQQKIADFLSTVDEVIAQSEKEVQNLEQQKKAAMQKIFSQEVRFKREDGTDYPEWEEKTVAEIFKITRGYVLSTKLVKSIADNEYCYPVFSSQTKDNGLMGYYKEYLYENAITWTTDGANAGTVRLRKGKFYCSNVCGVLLNETGFANQCIAEYLNSVAFKYVSYVGNPKLMNNIMAEIPIIIPCLEEQQKIADFFSNYDNAISYAKQELEKWKELKKGLLQQMFL